MQRLDKSHHICYTSISVDIRRLFAKWRSRVADGPHCRMALRELAEATGISYVTLKKAAQQERLEAHKSGKIWLSTPAAVERAQESGRMRRKR